MALFDLINGLVKACFYGEVLIKFEHGKIVLVEETKRHKDVKL
jgi:hypothetical protein